MGKSRKLSKKRGPKPNHLQIDDKNWENAAKTAIQKRKPKGGWPKKAKKS